MGIKMNLKGGVAALDQPGDYCFREHEGGVRMFVCVTPSRETITVAIHKADEQPKRERSWSWNGDEAKPTLQPSLVIGEPNPWHGWVTNGEMITC